MKSKKQQWLKKFLFPFKSFNEIPQSTFTAINSKLDAVISSHPLVSIVIIAWNEETNILRCVASLSETSTSLPIEIIVVNNNSTDNTQNTIENLRVKSVVELKQGAGPARQKGQENAHGKYILTADADCIYPPDWIDEMIKTLSKPTVACVYGRYSFIADSHYARWQLRLLETLKDIISEIRHFKQPYFNCFGISMGYIREYGLSIGFIEKNRRGEDGQLCMDLMKYGKIKQVRSGKARVWTDTRTLQKETNFTQILTSRLKKDFKRMKYNVLSRKP